MVQVDVKPTRDPMKLALRLARSALGHVSPNPAVGAVIVKDGRIVGIGSTQPPGQSHAEIVALQQAGSMAKGATMFVTLEPCSHYGRTPPCADAIISAGIAKVVVAIPDPNPQVSGRGIKKLLDAGISVQMASQHADEAMEINAGFLKWITTRTPLVIAKFAMTLDGKIATYTGDARWISCDKSRNEAHKLRQQVDAITVGKGTVLQDDPQLTTRLQPVPKRGLHHPLRVVVATRAEIPPTAKVFSSQTPGRTLLVVGEATPTLHPERIASIRATGHEVLVLPERDQRVYLLALLQELGLREVTTLLVEGGATLLGSFFDLGLIDKVVAFVAPILVGGSQAPSPIGGRGLARMSEAVRLQRLQVRKVGTDLMLTGYLRWPIVPLPSVSV